MAPRSNMKALKARGTQLSPGAIAGTVIGCVIGGSLLLIVLGFLYFRLRRKSREARLSEEILPTEKSNGPQRRTLFPLPGFLPRQAPATQESRPPSLKDDIERGVPTFPDGSEFQGPQSSITGDDLMRDHETYYTQNLGQPPLPPGIDFYLPPQPTVISTTNEPGKNLPLDNAATAQEAANSSYYDTRISMDSAPGQSPIPPSRQMTELYEAQLRQSREERRSGSLTSRIWSSFKRKRSTHSSTHGTSSPQYSTSQQYFPTSPVASPISIKPEAGLGSTEGSGSQTKLSGDRFFEEPGEMSENPNVSGTSVGGNLQERDQQQHKKQKRGDSRYDEFPLRTSSTIRETTEKDPELPSAALRSRDSRDGLPHSAQPQSEARPERLMSPAIPEPMELDETVEGVHRPSVFQSSHSPPLQPESFVSPMSIMQPSNAAEKAAYTHFQMENSMSPPTFPTPPPAIITDQPSQEDFNNFAQGPQDDFDADSFLDIPSDDEPRQSGDSYDYTTTPGQSSTTDPSMGRTPDTRITVSPSPYPVIHEHVKPEPDSSSSPEASKLSPQSPGHVCEECGRYFDQVHKLNHHKRYHDRKHECTYEGCDKKFGTKTHLDRHINDKHVKSKAYHCIEPTCQYYKGGKAFPRKDNWRRHMVKKHGATPNELETMDESMG
ncbi:hypothetical protein F4781DRAFT_207235 [Annulohypoxylon bovei var. microspora]|nr:hypothetical protein F4781DRAFT_207235 [Annulohypoxylon bovei var. microspora]